MRIIRLRIDGYGCLRGVSLEPGAGVTCIVGPNESGKSTLIASIISLLFDHSDGTQRDNALKERYKPWSGGIYGAEMEIEAGGDHLRIVRDFGDWRSRVLELPGDIDVTSKFRRNRIVDVGLATIGLDPTLFGALAVVRQRELVFGRDTAKRVVSLVESFVEAPTGAPVATQASERLSVWLKDCVNPGGVTERTSPLRRALSEVSVLEVNLQTARAALIALEPLAERERLLLTQEQEAECVLADAEHDLAAARAADLRNRLGSIRQATASADAARQARAQMGKLPEAGAVDHADQLAREAETLSSAIDPEQMARQCRIVQLQALLGTLDERLAGIDDPTLSQLASVEAAVSVRGPVQTSSPSPILIGALLAIVAGVIGYLAADLIGAAVGIILGGIVGFILAPRASATASAITREQSDLLAAWLRQIGVESVDGIRALRSEKSQAASKLTSLAELRDRDDARLRAASSRAAIALDAVGISSRGVAALAEVDALQQTTERARRLEEQSVTHDATLATLLGSDTVQSLEARLVDLELQAGERAASASRGLAELETAAQVARDQRDQAHRAAVAISAEREQKEAGVESPAALAEELAAANARLERLRRIDEAITRAKSRIATEATALRADVVPEISRALGDTFSAVTDDRYHRVTLDAGSLAISAESDDRTVPVGYDSLSQGTQDALLILLRLSVLDRMADTREPPPLILDDPLLAVDVDRARAIVQVLARIARNRQVIYLTHDERLAELIGRLDGAVVARLAAPSSAAIA